MGAHNWCNPANASSISDWTLKVRATLYRDVLQVHVGDLEKTLGDLAATVEHLLDRKAAA